MARPLPTLGPTPATTATGYYAIETWGCQMNVHDSEKLAGSLREIGMRPTADLRRADVILLNTCAIRDKATQKVYTSLGRLRRLKERKPELLIGVAGCVAQMEGEEIFRRAPHVDLVLGPRTVAALPGMLEQARSRRTIHLEPMTDSLTYPFESTVRDGGVKAYVTVMEGCNKRCTFCIVPRTRGKEESRALPHVLQEVAFLVDRGYREVELLGQNVNAYRHGGADFAALLRKVDQVPGLERIRFTTSHPLHFSDAIIDSMAAAEHVCPSLHLPPQSGSDRVLRRMRRGYTRDGYLRRIDRLRQAIPDVVLSADIIVGFPGETDDDFEETMSLLEKVRYEKVYSFLFSPRPGTVAEHLDLDTPLDVRRERLARLQARQLEIQREIHMCRIGSRPDVLVEGPARSGDGVYAGRTDDGMLVHFPGGETIVGRILPVAIERATAQALYGRLLPSAGPFLDFPDPRRYN